MNIRSMTGFARVRKATPDGELIVSLKSVNHRGLDLHFHAAAEFDPLENDMRSLLKQHVGRGHVDIRLNWLPLQAQPSFRINRAALKAYLQAYRMIAGEEDITADPDLTSVLRIPGMLVESAADDTPASLASAMPEALGHAIAELNQFREREGSALAEHILSRSQSLLETAERMQVVRDRVMPALLSRLQERLQELLRSSTIEPQRLTQEAAILADRGDIGEEIARLKIHAGQVEEILKAGGEVGKKLDFLCQELNREANTILSKTTGIGEAGLGITDMALAAKSDIEKIREQSLNLE